MVVTCGAAAPFWLRLGIPAFLRSRSVRFHAPHRHTSQPSGLHNLWSLSVIAIHSLARGWRYKALYTRLCLRCTTDRTPPCLLPLSPDWCPASRQLRMINSGKIRIKLPPLFHVSPPGQDARNMSLSRDLSHLA